MKLRNIVSLAVIAAAVSAGMPASSIAADPDTRAALAAGKPISANSQHEIEKTLGDVINQVLDKDFEDTVDNLAKEDRDRIGKASEQTSANLKLQVNKLKDAWKAKYGHAFDISGAQIPYLVTQTDTEGKRATVSLPSDDVVSALRVNLVNEGTVTNAWRIDLPNNITNAGLRSDLERAVKDINDGQAGWSANEKEAYRAVALRIFQTMSGSVS